MLVRFVKMSFKVEKTAEFLATFEANREKIRGFDGCQFLELLNDINNKAIYFTHSHWNSEEDLNNYRQSDLFKEVWAKTKILFDDKPEAWSVVSVSDGQ